MTHLDFRVVLERPSGGMPLFMAHRGSSDELPENTLAAMQRAREQGADILETDIRFTRDDEIILMHDATLNRTTNGAGTVAELTLAEIKKFRAQRSFESPKQLGDEPIPTLAEFLENTARPTAAAQALELKDDRFIREEDAKHLVNVLTKYDALERTVLLSFNGARVRSCKRAAPDLPIGIITLKNPFPLYETELMGPFYPLLYLNPFYFAWAKRRGKIACPLDPAPEPRLRWYRRLGAPVLLTNHPGVTRAAWEKLFGIAELC
jgi:glycerophosphoryl diester phosphodiesterase